ncbi:hypothetical protein PC116_g24709 [Phytophthora cactorum]|uniref:Uncharacterized protein n=1 Tax=Phytophthora cactorum TaxID=29920 RepID=A0A8T1BA69_9STRA|nr:hypothetical protein PC114_g22703 [Phytophthora cactorum]KAG2898587.1 hypothetical protein PC117_g22479 [Phytophthora cactorum]KAG2976432.1 hypothetical protein PC119_g22195 [Phytophthora cactorum]KAG2994956.1 hypothetical protein PC120_g21871 [Phytophthora cactorum]KAG3132258.1 hypothetical protein C6341_g22991 [Phytophthora cactorum]
MFYFFAKLQILELQTQLVARPAETLDVIFDPLPLLVSSNFFFLAVEFQRVDGCCPGSGWASVLPGPVLVQLPGVAAAVPRTVPMGTGVDTSGVGHMA